VPIAVALAAAAGIQRLEVVVTDANALATLADEGEIGDVAQHRELR